MIPLVWSVITPPNYDARILTVFNKRTGVLIDKVFPGWLLHEMSDWKPEHQWGYVTAVISGMTRDILNSEPVF